MADDFASLVESTDPSIYDLHTHGPGPSGSLPLTPEMLREAPSGDIFGMTQDVGMGWNPAEDAMVHLPGEGSRRCRRANYLDDGAFRGMYDPNERFFFIDEDKRTGVKARQQ